MKLDNPLLVRWEYASEERLAKRNAVLRSFSQGRNPEDAAFEAIAELKPKPARMVDIGCGLGELGERVQRALGTHVCAVDISPRMVELAKARGLDAQLADAEQLPFPDADFDSAFAGWVLYHVPDVGRAIAECGRVLRRDGALVATSVCNDNMAEVWDLIGVAEPRDPLSFTRETGEELLAKRFTSVERRDVDTELVFPDTASIRTFVASTIDRAHLAPQVPDVDGPFRATARHVVFVAKGPR